MSETNNTTGGLQPPPPALRGGKSAYAVAMEANFAAVKGTISCEQVAQLEVNLYPSGKDLRGPCPLPEHQGKSPSFYCYPNNGFFDKWHCHRCSVGGDVIDLYGKMFGLEHNPVWSMEGLADAFGVKLWQSDDFTNDFEKKIARAERQAERRIERVFTERLFERFVMPVIVSIEDEEERAVELQKALRAAGLER